MVKIENIFQNLIAIRKIELKKFKGVFENFKKSFESDVNTTVEGLNLFTKDEINYLNLELTKVFSELLNCYNVSTFVFNVTGIWKNDYRKNDFQGTHVHPSHFSFIIYVDVDRSHTVLNNPSKSLIESTESPLFLKEYHVECKKGDMLVFPSYLEHWVKPNSNNQTIAGNICFSDIRYK